MEPSYDSIPPILVFGIIIFDAWHTRACGVVWFQLFGLELLRNLDVLVLSNILRVMNLLWLKKYLHL
jgi:hypothetical protein